LLGLNAIAYDIHEALHNLLRNLMLTSIRATCVNRNSRAYYFAEWAEIGRNLFLKSRAMRDKGLFVSVSSGVQTADYAVIDRLAARLSFNGGIASFRFVSSAGAPTYNRRYG
jgi:hypothetical protein